MKVKKFLEKAAEEDRESLINDNDIEFLASIGVDYNKKREVAQKEPDASYYLTANAFNHRALLAYITCFLVATLTVSLILYFFLKPAPLPPIHYFTDNFVEIDSDLNELNADLELFTLVINENDYELKIKKICDSVSGDNIYYSLSCDQQSGLRQSFKLEIVVNSFYEHEQLFYTGELKDGQLSDYSIKYIEIFESVPDTPFSTVSCKGEMQIGKQWIYIVNYEETALGQSTFIETLQSIISFN